jgi:hypothetical protein
MDSEGFSPELRDLALLSAVIEPFDSASEQLLKRFAGVCVSRNKLRALTAEKGAVAEAYLQRHVPVSDELVTGSRQYVEIDGGMIRVDGAWEEAKVAVLFSADERVQVGKDRHQLQEKQVVGVRGTPEELATMLKRRVAACGTLLAPVVCIGDGAPWLWNLFARLFPERIEILDWFHVNEHVSKAAKVLYEEAPEEAERWRAVQLDRLEHDEAESVLEALRFARKATRSKAKREAVDDLERYLTTNRERIQYGTFRAQGLLIGSGAVEGAINHVVQQRMKRPGMRWKADGADHMLALRCVYRSTGHWDDFLSWLPAA